MNLLLFTINRTFVMAFVYNVLLHTWNSKSSRNNLVARGHEWKMVSTQCQGHAKSVPYHGLCSIICYATFREKRTCLRGGKSEVSLPFIALFFPLQNRTITVWLKLQHKQQTVKLSSPDGEWWTVKPWSSEWETKKSNSSMRERPILASGYAFQKNNSKHCRYSLMYQYTN